MSKSTDELAAGEAKKQEEEDHLPSALSIKTQDKDKEEVINNNK
jgi:hypothetical protein